MEKDAKKFEFLFNYFDSVVLLKYFHWSFDEFKLYFMFI